MLQRILLLFTLVNSLLVSAQEQMIPLWPEGKIPYSLPTKVVEKLFLSDNGVKLVGNVVTPGIFAYPAPKKSNTGIAVVICPGGGYAVEAYDHEGIQIAKQLNEWGINAFVLRYRLPDDSTMTDKKWVPLTDALQAIHLVRERAKEWGITPEKVGIMGFSAGGHLAATVSTHYDQRVQDGFKPDDVRPDFTVLCYPVVTMKENFTHGGSKTMLLGHDPSYSDVLEFSNETKVTSKTPAAFLIHTQDDFVAVQNTLQYANALIEQKVPVTCHILPKGGHGYGLAKDNPELGAWVGYWKAWMLSR